MWELLGLLFIAFVIAGLVYIFAHYGSDGHVMADRKRQKFCTVCGQRMIEKIGESTDPVYDGETGQRYVRIRRSWLCPDYSSTFRPPRPHDYVDLGWIRQDDNKGIDKSPASKVTSKP